MITGDGRKYFATSSSPERVSERGMYPNFSDVFVTEPPEVPFNNTVRIRKVTRIHKRDEKRSGRNCVSPSYLRAPAHRIRQITGWWVFFPTVGVSN